MTPTYLTCRTRGIRTTHSGATVPDSHRVPSVVTLTKQITTVLAGQADARFAGTAAMEPHWTTSPATCQS